MKKKLKILIEILLKRLPESWQERLSLLANNMKRRLATVYAGTGLFSSWISACDFIIVRTNGDRFIEFELTNICNAQCVFCPYPDMLRTDKKFMNMDASVLSKSIEKIRGLGSGMVSFTPTTGDTLLHPEWDRYIASVLEGSGIAKATMFTNAIKLDRENADKFIQLLKADVKGKMSQLYFSFGGLDAETYKALYKVDRFDLVRSNINLFLGLLKQEKMSRGIHIHVKLLKGRVFDPEKAQQLLNPDNYPFVYYSYSSQYFSNDGYRRNAIIDYYPDDMRAKNKACAYLNKTRFAADGGVWADGCVISEMPGDSSLKLGHIDDDPATIEKQRSRIITDWEQRQIIPGPCQGCTMYRCKRGK